MNSFILGSGLIGRIAKAILGWDLIPFKNSRYYAFDPPLADNYIVCHESVDKLFDESGIDGGNRIFLKRGFSVGGELLFNQSPLTVMPYVHRMYGVDKRVPEDIFNDRFVYTLSCKDLHHIYHDRFIDEIKNNGSKYGTPNHIDTKNRIIKTDKGEFGYQNLISTIPLDRLLELVGTPKRLRSRDVYYYYVVTQNLDLESCHIVYVVDNHIDFVKVNICKPDHYLFWCLEAFENPYKYLGLYLGHRMDIEGAWLIENVIPVGTKPDLSDLEAAGIKCVGSNAQWDDLMDVSSCVNRLISMRK